jgi:CheY-like chemotaxis protein
MKRSHTRSIDPRLNPGAILVVDDSPAICRALAALLEFRGWSTLVAANAAEAIHLLLVEPGRPRLAGMICDWKLGERDTAEAVLKWLDFAYPRTPVVIMSGLEAHEVPVLALAERAIAFEQKPLAPSTLDRILAERFGPWDREVIDARRFLIDMAGDQHVELHEHELRMMDAYLEWVPERCLGSCRGLRDGTAKTYLSRLRRHVFRVQALDEVKTAWERAHYGRGVLRSSGTNPSKAD